MPTTHSPLRYPGGKSSISAFLAEVIRLNGVSGGAYIEPYAGGAGAALQLLYSNVVEHIVINDFDPSIYAFWYTALNYSDTLLQKIETTPLTIDEWHHQKEILSSSHNHNIVEVGFAAFFLNRCNHSGIIMARPIGGLQQLGKYKLDARFKRSKLMDKIIKFAKYRDRVSVYNLDAIDLLQRIVPTIDKPKFIYLDPPYYEKGELLYLNSYTHEDHQKLANVLKMMESSKWMLTYDDSRAIKKMYRHSSKSQYEINYYAHHAKKGKELMITPGNMVIPWPVTIKYSPSHSSSSI